MPTRYKRKGNSSRGSWSEDQLKLAIEALQNGMGINEVSKQFNVPCTTLRRRLKQGNTKKGALGPSASLGEANERKIVLHIKKLQKNGFAPTRSMVRSMAFQLADQLKISHKFNAQKGKAGKDWFSNFLNRNSDLSIRKSEGVSIARARGMNHKDVQHYFKLLSDTLREKNLINKPSNIFNIDETGLQLNNRPEYVVAEKGTKNVAVITSGEKGETISVIVCCNAEGMFIPPTCIFKGKNKKIEYEDGMPPGSVVVMSEKSAYVNTTIFLNWLKVQFVPRKPNGPVILILDGHSSHVSSVELLEYAEQNNITLLCLPSHTTQFLQPLDRAFFKAFKLYYYTACNTFIRANPTRSINRLQFGKLMCEAWSKATTVDNAVSAFRSTGIFPLNPDIITEYAYLSETPTSNLEKTNNEMASTIDENENNDPTPTTSNANEEDIVETPGKLLDVICPVPSTSKVESAKNRGRQLATVLTGQENINKRRALAEKKLEASRKKEERKAKMKTKTKTKTRKLKNRNKESYSSSESDTEIILESDSECSEEDNYENECIGCGDNYQTTSSQEDWIKCITCHRWLHEGCTNCPNMCLRCARKAK